MGSFSPTLIGTSSNPTQSYSTQVGEFVKIGKVVIAQGRVVFESSGISPGSGDLQLAGFPFVVRNITSFFPAMVIGNANDFTNNGAPSHGFMRPGESIASLFIGGTGINSMSAASATNVGNNSRVNFSATYIVD